MTTPVAMTTAVVDVHAHAMPMPLLRWLADRGLADLAALPDRVVLLDPSVSGVGPSARLPLAPSQHDPALRLAEMDGAGVSHHAVSLPPFLFASTAADGGFVAGIVGRGNDELAGYVAAAPDRLVALGSVPLGWPGAAEEARRCLDGLGMAGIAIGSRGGGRDLDDPVNDDLWALLAQRRAFVFLHPSGVPDAPRLRDFYLAQLLGYPMETALAVARLVFGGVLERYDLVLCLAHGGGCLPAVRGRLDLGWHRKAEAHTTRVPPSELTGRLYYDTAVFSPVLLRRLIEDVGPGQVLLGHRPPVRTGRPGAGGDGTGGRPGRDRHPGRPVGQRGRAAAPEDVDAGEDPVITAGQAAEELIVAERERKEIPPFTDAHPDFDVASGYECQRLTVADRLDRGAGLVGRKLGLTSRNKQQAMGVSAPLHGVVTSDMIEPYGEPLDLATLIHPRAEPEIAFLLGTDLAGPASVTSVLAATEAVFGAIDILDSRYQDFRFTLADVVADNASAGRFLLGPVSRRPTDLADLRLVGCVLRVDGDVTYTAAGAAVMGHPAASVAWLANRLADAGEYLPAGSLIFSGGLTAPVPVRAGRSVCAEFDGLGAIEVYTT